MLERNVKNTLFEYLHEREKSFKILEVLDLEKVQKFSQYLEVLRDTLMTPLKYQKINFENLKMY